MVPVAHADQQGLVPCPSLLGAIIVKASAVSLGDATRARELDLALLLSMIADPAALSAEMTHKDRNRLRRVGLGRCDVSQHDCVSLGSRPSRPVCGGFSVWDSEASVFLLEQRQRVFPL